MDPEELKQLVADFLASSDMTPTQFGVRALNDPGFVFGINDTVAPRECRRKTVAKVIEFIRANTHEPSIKERLSRMRPINDYTNTGQLKNA